MALETQIKDLPDYSDSEDDFEETQVQDARSANSKVKRFCLLDQFNRENLVVFVLFFVACLHTLDVYIARVPLISRYGQWAVLFTKCLLLFVVFIGYKRYAVSS